MAALHRKASVDTKIVGGSFTVANTPRIQRALDRAQAWVLGLQSSEGGFPFSFHDLESIGAWPTSQAVAALLSSAPSMATNLDESLQWLENKDMGREMAWSPMKEGTKSLESTIWVALAFYLSKDLSRKHRIDVANIIDRIIADLNADGGWGSWKDDKSRVIITAQILSVLRETGPLIKSERLRSVISTAVKYLLGSQNSDGGWGFKASEKSNEVATAYSLIALSGIEDCRAGIALGLDWLTAQRAIRDRQIKDVFARESVWRDTGIQRWSYFVLPVTLYALALNSDSTQWFRDLRSMLAMQKSDGSWIDPDEPFLAFHTYTATYFLARIQKVITSQNFEHYCEVIDRNEDEEKLGILAAHRNRLKQLIIEDALIVSAAEKEFTLSSGQKSRYYYDLKRFLMNPVSVSLLGEVIWANIKSDGPDAIGGLETGAIPMSIAAVHESYQAHQPIRAFFVRKSPKPHGTKKWLEGNISRGDRVIILDDVVTTGGSVIQAIEKVQEYGCEILRVICVVDREEGGRQKIESMGIKFESLFVHREFEEIV